MLLFNLAIVVLPTMIHGFYKAGLCNENDLGLRDGNAIAERPNGTELNRFNFRLQEIFNDDMKNMLDSPDRVVFSCKLANAIADGKIKHKNKRRLHFTTYTRDGNISSVEDLITITFTGGIADTLDAQYGAECCNIFQDKKPKTYVFGCTYFIVEKKRAETICAFQKRSRSETCYFQCVNFA